MSDLLGSGSVRYGAATPAGQSRSGPAALGSWQHKYARECLFVSSLPLLLAYLRKSLRRFPLGFDIVTRDTRYIDTHIRS